MQCIYVFLAVMTLVRAHSYEDINIDQLLADPNKLQEFIDCYLDKAPCDKIAASFKKDIPYVIFYACDKCTPEEKHIVNAFITSFKKIPQAYDEFLTKYDASRKYIINLEAAVSEF